MTATHWQPVTLHRYGRTEPAELTVPRCLWPGVFGTRQPVQVVLVRTPGVPDGYELAIVSTDRHATPAELVERYADRWNIEITFEEARQILGVGQARNRTQAAVERTVPVGLACYALVIAWYALAGHAPGDVATHRARAPWYTTKHAPSTADMLAKLRRVLIAAQYRPGHPAQPTRTEILDVQAAWTAAGL